jgi:hypothetical protein
MAITNRITSGAPLTTSGVLGVQTQTFIPAARVFMKLTQDLQSAGAPPVAKIGLTGTAATLGTGWIDLGTLDGGVTTTYTKTKKDIKTGIDQKLRTSYISDTTFELSCNLLQVGDYLLQNVLGLTPSILQPGSIASFALGQETYGQYALCVVWQNKIDGKENQLYNPAAFIDATIADASEHLVLKFDAKFPAFTQAGDSQERLVSFTMYD